ncbi:GTP cyclohydrolase I [Bradyrhizobium neotropicale]|uniref:GTP cyclohydrolase I n=1 Tax=Bradyrhizobium neotropicale TaxID=1497615 RepID=UPI001AD76851|nr:GTP cyclohydrolase I [Bradyrhizobium neotropicale]MBO4221971.1 GTP cyclohydrolase I [Bradyrhizobium neotropicale]
MAKTDSQALALVTTKIEEIIDRLERARAAFKCNDCLADHVSGVDLAVVESEVEQCVRRMLRALLIDTDNDHNTRDTPRRVARMFMETFAGRFTKPPALTDFPNVRNLDELYLVGPVTVRSTCAHHLCPITGRAWYGVIPDGRVIGLSKFTRLAEWIFARPQIQEEAVVQLADVIEEATKPRGLAVVVKANHSCVTWRGVKDADGTMVTSVMRGLLKDSPAARMEFLTLIGHRISE